MNKKMHFFKPDSRFKQYMILSMIEKNPVVTQRELSKGLGIAVSVIHACLESYEQDGLIKRKYINTRSVLYHLTEVGKDRLKNLKVGYYYFVSHTYLSLQQDIITYFNYLVEKGYKKILLYGVNDLTELILRMLYSIKSSELQVLGVIDDGDFQNDMICNYTTMTLKEAKKLKNIDGVLITAYEEKETIYDKLLANGLDKEKILRFL